MDTRNFRLIKGGLEEALENGRRCFSDGYITDTRLMGVVGMCLHWKVYPGYGAQDIHQYFRIDMEDYGIETYQCIPGNDEGACEFAARALFGGLGGKKIPISEREACLLLRQYAKINKKFSQALPLYDEYRPLLEGELPAAQTAAEPDLQTAAQESPDPQTVSQEELDALFQKQCTPLVNPYHALNYFLMRCYTKDFTAARHMAADSAMELELFPDLPSVTLCKNTIDDVKGPDGTSYMCQSLLECPDRYILAFTELSVGEDLKITAYKRCSTMRLSEQEAAMMLNRSEFVTVFDITTEPDPSMEMTLIELAKAPICSPHENGQLFVSYMEHNDHVQQPVYRLDDDIFGLYFLSAGCQLIAAAHTREAIRALENLLRYSPIAQYLIPVEKYQFQEPVMQDFIESDFADFEEFVDFIMVED